MCKAHPKGPANVSGLMCVPIRGVATTCSQCGLCDTYYIHHVKDACAFLGPGMSRAELLEEQVHGRRRCADHQAAPFASGGCTSRLEAMRCCCCYLNQHNLAWLCGTVLM
jgi:hypothetical protein